MMVMIIVIRGMREVACEWESEVEMERKKQEVGLRENKNETERKNGVKEIRN